MYRAAIETILGFELRGNSLRINPCIPKQWSHFEMTYRIGKTEYKIFVSNPNARGNAKQAQVQLDGQDLPSQIIPLVDDGIAHKIKVLL